MEARKDIKTRSRFWLLALLVVVAIILILAVIPITTTVPRKTAYELAAIRACQTINTAQVQYRSTYGRYATTLSELGPLPGSASPSPSSADLIPKSLAAGLHQGYAYTMVETPTGYAVNAAPQAFGVTGSRTFLRTARPSSGSTQGAGGQPRTTHRCDSKLESSNTRTGRKPQRRRN